MAGYGPPEDSGDMQPDEPAADDAPDVELPDLAQLIEWFESWEEDTRDSQVKARRDRNYYDGHQWTEEEIAALELRHQPVTTNNRIAPKVNFILGEEVEKGVDPVVRPRTSVHEDDARAATDGLRNVEERQRFDEVRSEVFKNILIEGYGGALVMGNDDEHECCAPLMHVPWDRLFYDPKSSRPDFSDAKFKGVVVWMDLDDAIADFPDAEDILAAAVDESGSSNDTTDDRPRQWFDGKRKRVKICEIYFRLGKEHYGAHFTKGKLLRKPALTGLLDERGRHNVCPLIMASCYIDAENMRYGIVRHMVPLQDEINKRASKALHLLSVAGVIAERDVVRSPEKFMEELAKPDCFAEVEPGALTEGRIKERSAAELAMGQFQMLSQAIQSIDNIGPSAAMLPGLPENASGVAIARRQKSAARELAPVFASLRKWDLDVFQHNWMRIRQYKTEEWWLRVTDDRELTGYRFVALNQQMPRAQRFKELLEKGSPLDRALASAAGNVAPFVMGDVRRQMQQMAMQAQAMGQPPPQGDGPLIEALTRHPLMAEMVTLNQVAQMDVDIMLDESPESSVEADDQFQGLLALMPAMVQAGMPPPFELLIEASSLPDKRQLREVLKKKNEPNPQAQMQQQLLQQMQQLQAALTQAQIQKTQADAQLSQARAQSEMASIGQAQAPQAPSPLEHAKAQREGVNTQLDVEKARAVVERERASAASHVASAAAKAQQASQRAYQAMQPEVIGVEVIP